MMIDLKDEKYGRLTVMYEALSWGGHRRWSCKCECGNWLTTAQSALTSGNTKSCGCIRKEMYPDAPTGQMEKITKRVWRRMISRCENENDEAYKNHGALGIKVCDRWRQSFKAFVEDMGTRPRRNLKIGRVDKAGNYEPENCEWVLK